MQVQEISNYINMFKAQYGLSHRSKLVGTGMPKVTKFPFDIVYMLCMFRCQVLELTDRSFHEPSLLAFLQVLSSAEIIIMINCLLMQCRLPHLLGFAKYMLHFEQAHVFSACWWRVAGGASRWLRNKRCSVLL